MPTEECVIKLVIREKVQYFSHFTPDGRVYCCFLSEDARLYTNTDCATPDLITLLRNGYFVAVEYIT